MLLIANHVSCAKTRKELDLGSEHVNSRVSLLTTLSRCMDGRLPKEWKGGSLRNGRAPASDLESTYSTEEIICLFFFSYSSVSMWSQPQTLLTNGKLNSIFKSRDITLPTKVHLVKAMVFPVVMYGYKSWTVTKAER